MRSTTGNFLNKTVRLWQRFVHGLFAMRRDTTLAIAGVLFSVIFIVDSITPPQLNLTFLYVFVILLVCWNVGALAGILFALLSSAVQFFVFSEAQGLALPAFYRYIILGNRAFVFLLVVGLTVPLRQLYEREQRTSRTDFLTDALNRMALYELLVMESARSRRTGKPFSVAYIDCDRFKAINDLFGHEAGDALLRSVGKTIKRVLRLTDAVARIGGDEFVVFLPETDAEMAAQIIERLRAELAGVMSANQWAVTFSIGLGTFNQSEFSPEQIVQKCDALMYGVKGGEKNGIAAETFPGVAFQGQGA